jgi:DmsE family decaheme c-type cytochrome
LTRRTDLRPGFPRIRGGVVDISSPRKRREVYRTSLISIPLVASRNPFDARGCGSIRAASIFCGRERMRPWIPFEQMRGEQNYQLKREKLMRILKLALISITFFCALTPILSTRIPAQERKAARREQTEAKSYAGSAQCAQCHSEEAVHTAVTAHRSLLARDARPELRGCESCHGPAQAHVDFHLNAQNLIKEGKQSEADLLYRDEAKAGAARMGDLEKLPPGQSSAICLKCHEGAANKSEERFNFRRGEHARHGVSCLDCHAAHKPKKTENLLRAPEPEGCYSCHSDQKSSFARPFHHKVPEGAMKCSDCHNQHGGFQMKQLRTGRGQDPACVKCHTDKAGPFVFEHAAARVEGCQTCHNPHGSTNPRLLKRNDVRFLCLECHSNAAGVGGQPVGGGATPNFHDLSQPRWQNCTTCHLMIHGSNNNRAFLR